MFKENLKSIVNKEWKPSILEKISGIIDRFSATERVLYFFFAVILITSGLTLLYQVNKEFLVEVPDYGGSLVEGVIGSPRFVNPLLSNSDVDKDLIALIYSGLLKNNSEGELILDLAESYEISPDGLSYTIKLKNNIYFHDGKSVTADDIIYTVERAQDPELKSPRETNWMGVEAQKIDERTVNFTLKQAYSPFIQNLTLGILPKHIWQTANSNEFPFSQFNTKAIGSGPYMIDEISYTDSGLPNEYHLKSFKKYILGKPFINNITIKSYQDEKDLIDGWKNGEIDSFSGVSPKELASLEINPKQIIKAELSRIFGVFFNQSSAQVLLNKEVREALNISVDKQEIINSVLGGYGKELNSLISLRSVTENETSLDEESRIEKAREILTKKGWKQNDDGIFEKKDKKSTTLLSFSISTGDAPELKETAVILQRQWSKLGASIDVKIFDISDLNQNIIKPRKYDSILFGEIVGRDFDLYPFWHSSGRLSPGLNIALYTNLKADKLLENIRRTTDKTEQKKYFDSLVSEIENDIPAIFTYSPYFIYIVPDKTKNISLGMLTNPSERFSDVQKWYIETNNVWKIFNNN
ncbi:MAG: ABC transporter substrate-binding protein [Minisyncoccia bacterium]